MNYFLDTCVKIAFVFCTDPWNDETYELFDNKHVFYCSYNVEKEFDGKYNDILKEHSSFFYALKDDLNQNFKEYITLSDLKTKSKIIDFERDFDENKKEKISEIIWNIRSFICKESLVVKIFDTHNIIKIITHVFHMYEIGDSITSINIV